MSSNRLTYDTCAYQSKIKQSSRELEYMMYTGKYNNNKVFPDQVSLYSGNLVDLESNLRGQTKMASNCSSKMFNPMDDYKLSKKLFEGFQSKIDYANADPSGKQYAWYVILVCLFPNTYKNYLKNIPILINLNDNDIAYLFGKNGINYIFLNYQSLIDTQSNLNAYFGLIFNNLKKYYDNEQDPRKLFTSNDKIKELNILMSAIDNLKPTKITSITST